VLIWTPECLFVFSLSVVTTNEGEKVYGLFDNVFSVCEVTQGGPQPNQPCIFPFIYSADGETYTSCTRAGEPLG